MIVQAHNFDIFGKVGVVIAGDNESQGYHQDKRDNYSQNGADFQDFIAFCRFLDFVDVKEEAKKETYYETTWVREKVPKWAE